MEISYPDNICYMFDKLIEHTNCLYKLNTSQSENIFKHLDQYQTYTGKASYFWKSGQGLYRIDLPNIYAPHTESLQSALEHISRSIHFGIYLFTDVGDALLSPRTMKILVDLADNNNQYQKVILFAGQDLKIPYFLDKKFTLAEHKSHSIELHRNESQTSIHH